MKTLEEMLPISGKTFEKLRQFVLRRSDLIWDEGPLGAQS